MTRAFETSWCALGRIRRRRANLQDGFQKMHPKAKLSSVAYFSMEFGLSEALPIYSGGLGNVAGDQLKSAMDGVKFWLRPNKGLIEKAAMEATVEEVGSLT